MEFLFDIYTSFQSKVFISYFSHHKPVVSFLDYDNIQEDIDLQNQLQEDSGE